jgi:hypothetical protein
MIEVQEQYLVDETGNRKAVVIPLDVWHRIQADMEELDDIRAYDTAKARPSAAIPFEQAVSEIEQGSAD